MSPAKNAKLQQNILREDLIDEAIEHISYAKNVDEAIEGLLQALCEMYVCKRTGIFERSARGDYNNTYEWCPMGVHPEINHLQNVPAEALTSNASNSSLFIPLAIGEPSHGVLYMDGVMEETDESDAALLSVVTKTFVTLIRQRNAANAREASNIEDTMTGIANRRGFYHFAEMVRDTQCIGLISCDLNGIKAINESQGYESGGDAINKLANILLENFRRQSIFRVGGDTFTVCCPDLHEDVFDRRVEILRKIFAEQGLNVSVGAVWTREAKTGIEELAAAADAARRADKEAAPQPARPKRKSIWD